MVCVAHCRHPVKNYDKSLEKLQDFFFKTETKTNTFIFVLEATRVETKTLVSRTTSLPENHGELHDVSLISLLHQLLRVDGSLQMHPTPVLYSRTTHSAFL